MEQITKFTLKNVDSLDISELLYKIEKSFEIKLEDEELENLKTFGELTDLITGKIQLENLENCTTQQAFYKLKKTIKSVFNIENVKTETQLSEIFPRKTRISDVKLLNGNLDFKTDILMPKSIVVFFLVLLFLFSLVELYFNWKIGVLSFITSIIGFKLSETYGKELKVKTIGELAKKITRENYVKSRTDSKTFNKNEIEKIVTDWFMEQFDLEKSDLKREATFA